MSFILLSMKPTHPPNKTQLYPILKSPFPPLPKLIIDNFIHAGQGDPQRVRSKDNQSKAPPRQHAGHLPKAPQRGSATLKRIPLHSQPTLSRIEHVKIPEKSTGNDAKRRERDCGQVPAGGGAAGGAAVEQEEIETRERDRAAHPPQEQTRTLRSHHQTTTTRIHRKSPLIKIGGSHLGKRGAPGGVQQDRECDQEIQ